jgi:hypothetical protein
VTGNGIPARIMGNGEGHTCLILTDAESRLIRRVLADAIAQADSLTDGPVQATVAYNRGIQRATDRIAAEFNDEMKRRKDGKK